MTDQTKDLSKALDKLDVEKKYVLAVSGGVDSVVLLDLVINKGLDVIVAHYDHCVRSDSAADARFVEQLAKHYDVDFRLGSRANGVRDDEASLRLDRYDFLFEVMKELAVDNILVAHHRDDLVETVLMSLERGTGRRGLTPFQRPGLIRPLLSVSKKDIYAYAVSNNLEWVEDSSNSNLKYTRNKVRKIKLPELRSRLPGLEEQIYSLYRAQEGLNTEIDQELNSILSGGTIDRTVLTGLDEEIGLEILHQLIKSESKGVEITSRKLKDLLESIATCKGNSRFSLSKDCMLEVGVNKQVSITVVKS